MQIYLFIALLLCSAAATGIEEDDYGEEDTDSLLESEYNKGQGKQMGDKIREIIEHFKQPDPVGLPGAPIPDPMDIPDMKRTSSFNTITLKNATFHGLSKFRIDQIYSNLAKMEVEIALRYLKLEVLGNYTLQTWVSKSQGGFNVTLVGVYIEGLAVLDVARDGYLEATDIKMDIVFENILLDFKNLGFLGSVFQGMINVVGTLVYDSVKPLILAEFNTNIRGNVNEMLKEIKQTFPNSIPPLDLAIAEARKKVRNSNYDPYEIGSYNNSVGLFSIDVTNIVLRGLATFYRVGNVTLAVSNNTIHLGFHISTHRLKGECNWEVSATRFISRGGSASFTVDYLMVEMKINQSLNIKNRPKLDDMQLEIGNIQLRMDGVGTLDYVLEFVVNVLPNILRYQIVDAVEGVLRRRIQDNFDSIDMERSIDGYLKTLDTMSLNNSKTTNLYDKEYPNYRIPNDFDEDYDADKYLV